jgi:hypothetical protein
MICIFLLPKIFCLILSCLVLSCLVLSCFPKKNVVRFRVLKIEKNW